MYRRNRSRAANVNAAVWLIGLGILWITNLWWPGILILIGISMLVQVLVRSSAVEPAIAPPPATTPMKEAVLVEEPKKDTAWESEKAETPAFIQSEDPGTTTAHNEILLPKVCPVCGGPVAENAHKVEWLGEKTARCPFCNAVLNL